MMTYDDLTRDGLRALFCIGITQEFFSAEGSVKAEVGKTLKSAFDDLQGRFGVKVLGTFDDDLLQAGASRGYPFISYIMADIPDLKAAIEVNNLMRTPVLGVTLQKYLTIDTRLGHPLFFGTK